jgi:hypothetical protein
MIATFSMDDLSSIDKILPNFNLKNMISTYLKDFSIKKSPNSPDFKGK